jgi:hypothetical protein
MQTIVKKKRREEERENQYQSTFYAFHHHPTHLQSSPHLGRDNPTISKDGYEYHPSIPAWKRKPPKHVNRRLSRWIADSRAIR